MPVTYGTTDRCTGGTASASNYSGTDTPAKAFDDNNTTYWTYSDGLPQWVQYDFGSGVSWKISKITLRPILNYGPLNFTVLGSNNGTDFITLYSGTALNSETVQEFTFTNRTKYRYIRINVTSGSNNQCATTEIQMFEGIYPPQGAFLLFLCEAFQRHKKLWTPEKKLILPKDLGFSY